MSPSLVMLALPFSLIGIVLVANAFLPAAQPQEAGSGPEAEVIAALRAYTGAISQKDIEACTAAYAPGPDSVMLGAGPGERRQGPDEIRDAPLHFSAVSIRKAANPHGISSRFPVMLPGSRPCRRSRTTSRTRKMSSP